jgi:hypothetical protein
MRISRFVKGAAVLAVLAVAVVGAGFGAKSADAQSPYVSANGPYSGTVGNSVVFSATVSPSFGAIAGATWTFSDGVALNGLSVSRVFNVAGPYTATVTVRNTFGTAQSSLAYVTIVGVSPILPVTVVGPQVCATTDSSAPRIVCSHGTVVQPVIGGFPVVHGAIGGCTYGVVVVNGVVQCAYNIGAVGTLANLSAYCYNTVIRTINGIQTYCAR